MGVFQNNLLAGAAAAASAGGAGFYDYQIEQSMRFDSADGTNLYLGGGSTSGNNDYWTFSFWYKGMSLPSGTSQEFISAGNGTTSNSDNLLRIGLLDQSNGSIIRVNSGTANIIDTSGVFRDPSAWTHVVWNNNNGSSVLYVNGTQVGSGTLDGGSGSAINKANGMYISRERRSAGSYVDGYLAEVMMISASSSAGTLTPSSFGETKNGVWVPKDISGLSNQDFYLKFENASDLGNDSSGNNRDWDVYNAGTDHQVLDSPTFGS
jgi:hypothetical protein